jgi:hypothetical protein
MEVSFTFGFSQETLLGQPYVLKKMEKVTFFINERIITIGVEQMLRKLPTKSDGCGGTAHDGRK